MEKTYNPKYIEQHWSEAWEDKGYFIPSGKNDPYCIVIPPPNVTGTLHMGHGFQHSLMDVLIRYHRMCGFNTLWQVGLDHAGIATQMVVMQQLLAKGKDPYKMSREEFEQHVWEWKEQSRNGIDKQMRRIGVSADWQRERFTMDEGFSSAVHKVFVDLYDEGLIYRGQKLINWDPILNTAISDLEVVFEEQDGFLWFVRYPLENSKDYIVIATTRPETILGDVAIAVHPEDERFKHLVGKYAYAPLTERRIPIIADDYVDPEFGAGCLKITPAHDFNDYAIGKRHDLPLINIFTPKAQINENAPKIYQGLDRFIARKKIVEDLKTGDFLIKIEPYKVKVPKCDRTDAIIEPYLTDQWFIKMKTLAKPAIDAVVNGDIKFIPENWSKTYLQWLENIEDWCISRQLWWGHRVPAWYDAAQNIYVGNNESEVRNKYKLAADVELKQDNDVLDTWFSSALWPFVTLGWPKDKVELKTFYPTSVLVTGFDIIFFWVARMVMMGLKFTGEVPFKEVYITGLIRDGEGQKMSKSRGNVLDPIDLVDGISLEALLAKRTDGLMQLSFAKKIEQATRREFPSGIKAYGMDALRFTYCALASTGRDINFDINRLEGYRNFCNKIWNATRFVLMQQQVEKLQAKQNLTLADRWIVSRLQTVIRDVREALSNYRFDLLAQNIYEFIWHEYCDWYLELCKAEEHVSHTMVVVLETILRLIHPIMPFISEEIWQQVKGLVDKQGETIMREPYPEFDDAQIDENADATINWLKKAVVGIRNIRGEMDINPSKPMRLLLNKGSAEDKTLLKQCEHYLMALANLETIEWMQADTKIQRAATALVGDLELYVPLANLIDLSAEKERLNKEINKLQKDIDVLAGRLNNPAFVERAPQEIVQSEQVKLQEKQTALTKLLQRREAL
jgi:valyl-tRNA synthetase